MIWIGIACILLIGLYFWLFYPRQIMPVGKKVMLDTPTSEKYHNDCLHPCVRLCETTGWKYAMVQSPLYAGDESAENPILYFSDSLHSWTDGIVVRGTPRGGGYNSDPNIFIEDGKIFVFWREFMTDNCRKAGTNIVTFGCYTEDGKTFSESKVYLRNTFPTRSIDGFPSGDSEQCPILIKRGSIYYFYAVCEDYSDYICKGLALWVGHSLIEPDFVLDSILPFYTKVTVGKWLQKRIGGKLFFIPKPVRQMLWHFDIFEYHGVLYLIFGVAKGKGNILISRSKDWKHFETSRIPMVNNHYSENFTGYRQYYYKSTALVEDDVLHLFYTAQDKDDGKQNVLFHTTIPMQIIENRNDYF